MRCILAFTLTLFVSNIAFANSPDDRKRINRAVLDYIESQHKAEPILMKRGLDKKLAKRTYWKSKDGAEFIMETDFDTMIRVLRHIMKMAINFPSHQE